MMGILNLERPPQFFGKTVLTVVGQALEAAGYIFQSYPLFTDHGLFRFRKDLDERVSLCVEFQFLSYPGGPARFRVNLLRQRTIDGRSRPTSEEKTLCRLLWDEFGVQQLGRRDYWWTFTSQSDLTDTLAEVSKLIFEYAIPWLEGKQPVLKAK